MTRWPSDCADPQPGGMLGPPMQRARPRPGSFIAWPGVLAGLLAAAALVGGCAKKPGTTVPDAAMGGAEAAPSDDTSQAPARDEALLHYEVELEGHEDAMLAAGLALPPAAAQARSDRGKASVPASDGGDARTSRCERICGLATSVCELRDRICDLADEHGSERRYAEVCERATADCERATQACEGCDG